MLLMADCWALDMIPGDVVEWLLVSWSATVADEIVSTGPELVPVVEEPVVLITWMLKLTSTLLFSPNGEALFLFVKVVLLLLFNIGTGGPLFAYLTYFYNAFSYFSKNMWKWKA